MSLQQERRGEHRECQHDDADPGGRGPLAVPAAGQLDHRARGRGHALGAARVHRGRIRDRAPGQRVCRRRGRGPTQRVDGIPRAVRPRGVSGGALRGAPRGARRRATARAVAAAVVRRTGAVRGRPRAAPGRSRLGARVRCGRGVEDVERRVVAGLDRGRRHRARDPLDLVEAGQHQVLRQRRVAEDVGLLLALAEEVVDERRERLALVGVERRVRRRRNDHVAVARHRVGPWVRVGVHRLEVLGEVGVDGRLGQRHRDVARGRLRVVARLVEQPDDREVDPLGIGVLDVADRAGAVGRGDVVGHAVGADLRLGAAERRVEGHARAAAAEVQLALDERAVDRRRLAGHVLRELGRRAGAVGAHHRDDRDVRQRLAVVGGDRGVAPARDGAGEDLRQRGRREPQVTDPLPADREVVHERRAAGHDRQVGELPRRRLGLLAGLRRVLERDLGVREVHRRLDELRAAVGRAGAGEVDDHAAGADVGAPGVDRDLAPGRPRAGDGRVRVGQGRRGGHQDQPHDQGGEGCEEHSTDGAHAVSPCAEVWAAAEAAMRRR